MRLEGEEATVNIEGILIGLLCIGGGIYVLVCPERVWKIVLYPRLHQWPDREPFSWELLMTRLVGGASTLFGLLACFGYL